MKNHLEALRWVALNKTTEEYNTALAVASVLNKWCDDEETIINGVMGTNNSPIIKAAYLYIRLLENYLENTIIKRSEIPQIRADIKELTILLNKKVSDKCLKDLTDLLSLLGIIRLIK